MFTEEIFSTDLYKLEVADKALLITGIVLDYPAQYPVLTYSRNNVLCTVEVQKNSRDDADFVIVVIVQTDLDNQKGRQVFSVPGM